ncbi:MAG TPA: Rieske 2Fe-2S domain-containing protein [Blastocatellia bacterium]|nr:Rieske 2Fe-2S domain-containing protein [Blastocatellia bacterium]HMX26632.1 Rieske 2Fe-2S domain-containing protein [Blastocatellia bacterium]HMY73885.1 Rieske 2Fe-2S domain-containing protein [Blastocatellia bacterium]HMZ20631.1 Rieske 2Fe-2S domain-containing protein [Blastocatellia bacterium]HNG29882.1 Rieske 2Fe-2S domain-containing protein [Blastocatellia bacterium]
MTSSNREQITIPPDGRPQSEQPEWRRDFPIDWPEDHYVARRDFTKFMVLTSFAFVAGQTWIAAQNFRRSRRGQPPMMKIAALNQLAVGQSLAFNYPAEHDTCLLVRTGENNFVAFDQRCTHLSCAVVPEPGKKRFFCPCHNGSFDLETGKPLAGPPRRPLARVQLQIVNNEIYATGIELTTV